MWSALGPGCRPATSTTTATRPCDSDREAVPTARPAPSLSWAVPAEIPGVGDVPHLQPGPKALHIHQVGRCESPSFESAGQHFNPGGAQHGAANPRGPHAGDLPNITIDETGRGRLEVLVERFSIRAGPDSLFDADGSAIVIHAAPDDMNTDPSGNSGARIACGPLVTSGVARAS
jgi:Cu/Zn superoxide dismutase